MIGGKKGQKKKTICGDGFLGNFVFEMILAPLVCVDALQWFLVAPKPPSRRKKFPPLRQNTFFPLVCHSASLAKTCEGGLRGEALPRGQRSTTPPSKAETAVIRII